MNTLDQRSQDILQQIESDIVLTDKPIFLNNYVHFRYRFKDEEPDEVHELLINSPLEFAAFVHHQRLIAEYSFDEEGVHLYQRVDYTDFNRYQYIYNKVGFVEIQRLHTGFTEQEIIKMIARREHDFGTRKYQYGAKQGKVIPMFPNNTTTQNAA